MASRVGIVGASGYSGATLARIAAGHPGIKLAFVTSDRHEGERACDRLGGFFDPSLRFSPNASAVELAASADVVFLATSAEIAAKLAPAFADLGKLTIDLSGAFRLGEAAAYPQWYGFEHPAPAYLASAFYGLPEVFGPPPEDAVLISNPGCYATATILALTPVLKAGLAEPSGIFVDAKSGVSGAGRQAKEAYSFVEANEDLRAYKLLSHQHTPEIERAVTRGSANGVTGLAFVPHLLPLSRGLLVTCYLRARPGATKASVSDALRAAYAESAFVRVVAADEVSIHAVAGTNFAYVGAESRGDAIVVVCALDNLIKGAAGQAVQNMNLALGLGETLGLGTLARIAP